MKLGVNIDHIASLRNVRKINDPSIANAALIAHLAGADQITMHLREDRRHINEEDLKIVSEVSLLPLNIECAIDEQITQIIIKNKPSRVTLVPEKREEVTTEGGLNLKSKNLDKTIALYHQNNIEVSLFVNPNIEDIKRAKGLKVEAIELHTGAYANIFLTLYSNLSRTRFAIKSLANLSPSTLKTMLKNEISNLATTAKFAKDLGLEVYAGHGLNYDNVGEIAKIQEIQELNIGHSIIARAVLIGLKPAIEEIKALIKR